MRWITFHIRTSRKAEVKKPSYYEQVGIIVPGAVLVFGLLVYFPSLRDLLAKDGMTVGQLGIYVLISYASGNLVAALGDIAESPLWWCVGGMPTDWLVKPTTRLIAPQQREAIEKRLRSRLGIDVKTLRGMDRKDWFPISRQIYSDVARYGKANRIDIFNVNYGLNRGLAAACLILACVAASQQSWWSCALLAALTAVYGFRAYRFGIHYARELFLQFLTIRDKPAKTPSKKRTP
jgi:hypothetical protein